MTQYYVHTTGQHVNTGAHNLRTTMLNHIGHYQQSFAFMHIKLIVAEAGKTRDACTNVELHLCYGQFTLRW